MLVHMGLDTVEMDGEPFETKIAAEDEVQAGDVLSQVDIAAIKASNRDPAVVVVFTNMEKVKAFDAIKAGPCAWRSGYDIDVCRLNIFICAGLVDKSA